MIKKIGIGVGVFFLVGAAFAAGPVLSEPVAEATFVALDLKTTGPDHKKNRVMGLSAVKFRGDGSFVSATNWVVNPHGPISDLTTEATGITEEQVAQAPNFEAVWVEFETFCGGAILLMDTPRSDTKFLRAELKLAKEPIPSLPVADAQRLFHAWFPNAMDYSLESLAPYVGLAEEIHSPMDANAFYLARIFEAGMKNRSSLTLWRMDLDVGGFRWITGSRCR